jgi:predicted ester cyclase
MPATNKKVQITGISVAQIENGKIIRGWDNWDQLGLMQQLSFGAAAAR